MKNCDSFSQLHTIKCVWKSNYVDQEKKNGRPPGGAVILSVRHQVIDVGHADFLNVVSLYVFEADLRSHQRLLSPFKRRNQTQSFHP